jgi:hypothetical protein
LKFFDKPPQYRSYLITFWEERSQQPDLAAEWRFSLESPRTGTRRGFATFDALVAALEQEISQAGEE